MIDEYFSTLPDTVIHVTPMTDHLPIHGRIYHIILPKFMLDIEVRKRQYKRT